MVTVALDGRGVEQGTGRSRRGSSARDGGRHRAAGLRRPRRALAAFADAGAEVIEAPGEISNEDDPVASVRSREDASIVMAAADVAEGHSHALVSAGPTGATMTAALFALRRLSGVRRPSLAVQLPTVGHDGPPTLLLDAGANSEARSQDLVQSAVMGAAFSRAVLGVDEPTGRAALGRRGVEEGHRRGGRGARRARGHERDQLHREHRGPRPARGRRRGDRDRRLHRQRRAEDARGDREDRRIGRRLRRSLEPGRRPSAA